MKKSILLAVTLTCFTFGSAGLVAGETKEQSTAEAKKITRPENAKKPKADESRHAASDSQKKTKKIIIPGKDLS